jgi:branched-chain amino acid transport system permease protein
MSALAQTAAGRQAVPIAILAALAIVPLLTRDDYLLGVWTFILLNIIVVVGLDVLLGYAGQLSLGHGAFVAIGAYASALLTTKLGWSGWAAIPVGMMVAALVAALIAVPTLRLRGYYLAMATLGFPILFDAIIRVGSNWSGGSSGVTAIPRLALGGVVLRDPTAYYYLVLAFLAVVLLLVWNLMESRLGLRLRAIHADEAAAMARGIHVVRTKIGVFTLSAAIAALGGSLYVHNVQFVAAGTFGLNYSLMLVVMLVAGGMGRIWGGVVGVIVLGWLPELLRDAATWQPVIFGVLLALIMLFSPSGLAGLVRRRSSFGPRSNNHVSDAPRHRTASGPLLRVSGLRKRFGGVTAVSDLTFDVAAGEIRSIIGPNGAGKSTALALVSGALPADAGSVQLAGEEFAGRPAHERARAGLGRTFQHARLIPTLTVFENIVLGASMLGGSRRDSEGRATCVLESLGLGAVAQRFPDEINHFERRLTEVGSALAARPALVLLDEPAAGLSAAEIELLANVLREERDRGTAIVLVDHIMALVMPLSDRILVLDGGAQIADGDPSSVTADARVRSAYLGQGAAHA